MKCWLPAFLQKREASILNLAFSLPWQLDFSKMKLTCRYTISILMLLLMFGRLAFAQDRIIKINNDTIRAKVVKITTDKIIYRYPGMQTEHLPEIYKNNVKEIIYANGSKLKIIYNMYEVSSDLLVKRRNFVVKADLGAPFLNHITIGLEIRLKTGLNLELKGGLIGPGFSSSLDKADGFLVKAGVKFVRCGTAYSKGLQYTDALKGSYLKPEFMYSRFTTVVNDQDTRYTNYAINLVLGKQYLPVDFLTLDFFGGLGFGIQSSTYVQTSTYDKHDDYKYVYSHVFFGKELPVVLSGGFTVGIAF